MFHIAPHTISTDVHRMSGYFHRFPSTSTDVHTFSAEIHRFPQNSYGSRAAPQSKVRNGTSLQCPLRSSAQAASQGLSGIQTQTVVKHYSRHNRNTSKTQAQTHKHKCVSRHRFLDRPVPQTRSATNLNQTHPKHNNTQPTHNNTINNQRI